MSIHAVVEKTMCITDPAIEEEVRTPLCYSGSLADFFGVALLNETGTGAASLTNMTVSAHFIRGDGYYGMITGATDGNVAYVILPDWCYKAQGRWMMFLYLTSGSATRPLMIARGRQILDTTNSMIDPEHVIPDLAALIAEMQNISAAIAKITNMTASASTLAAGQSPTASLSEVDGHYHVAFGIPQGAKGDPGDVSSVNGISPDGSGNVTIPNATQSASGVMSATDKTKLDGLPASAAVPGSIAIIVDGDTAGAAVAPGAYAYIKNNTHGLAEGLYKNKSSSAFPTSGGTADSTVFEAVPNGGLNSLLANRLVREKYMITAPLPAAGQLEPIQSQTFSKSGYTPVMYSITPGRYMDYAVFNAESITISNNAISTGVIYIKNVTDSSPTENVGLTLVVLYAPL